MPAAAGMSAAAVALSAGVAAPRVRAGVRVAAEAVVLFMPAECVVVLVDPPTVEAVPAAIETEVVVDGTAQRQRFLYAAIQYTF